MGKSYNRKYAFKSLETYILNLIQNKVFLGRYSERRYVESLQAYRDIIIIESHEDIIKNLMETKKALEAYAKNAIWIGISNDPQNNESNDCLLWVQLNDVPIGKHWFQMSAIRFEPNEIILEVQYVQPYKSPDKSFHSIDPDFISFDLKEILTQRNLCEAFKFSAIVVMTLITFAVEALKYLGEYSIKLGYLIVSFVQVSMPIFFAMFEFLTKCVGGFYWLIYVMFRGNSSTPVVPGALVSQNRNYRPIEYRQNNSLNRLRQNYPKSKNWKNYQSYQ